MDPKGRFSKVKNIHIILTKMGYKVQKVHINEDDKIKPTPQNIDAVIRFPELKHFAKVL